MFDLFRSREKSVRYILGALLTLVALSMVITLVPGFGSGRYGGGNENLIAKIGDQELTVQEVRQAIQGQIQRKVFPAEMAQFYVPIFVQSMVSERAAAYQARRMGVRITDQEVADTIVTQIPQLMENGKFVGKEAYAAMLASQNLTIDRFEEDFRKQMELTRLRNLVLDGVVVTPAEVENEFRKKNEKLQISYVVLNTEKFSKQVTVTPQEIQDLFAKSRQQYMRPESRNFLLFAVDDEQMAKQIKTDDATLRKIYDAQKDRFKVEERVKIRHILVMTQDKPKEQVDALRKKAEDLLKQVKSGADFGELAKKNSDDPGSKEKGGDLGFVVRGQTVPEFEKTAFTMKSGDISNIVQTTYGFHLLKCEGHEFARIRTFEEVKNELAAESARDQVQSLTQKVANEIRSALIKSPADAEAVAAKYGIPPVKVEKAGRGDPIPEVGVNPDFQDSAFRLPKDGVTSLISVANKLVVARVTGLNPPTPRELPEVEGQLKSQIEQQKVQQLIQAKVKEFQDKLKASNGDLAAAAKSFGLEVKTPPAFTHDDKIDGVGTAMTFNEAFNKNAGETGGPLPMPSGTYFYKVVEKIPPDLTLLAAQRGGILDALKTRKAKERDELFQEGIVSMLTKEKKLKIYDDNVKRLVNSYRSS